MSSDYYEVWLTENNAMYNFEDTFENKLFKIMGAFVPDNMEEAQTMRFQILKLLKACPSSVTSDIRNVITVHDDGGNIYVANDHAWSDFMVSKLQHHREAGSYNHLLNYGNISLHLKRLIRHRTLHTVLHIIRQSTQRDNQPNNPTHQGIPNRPRTVPRMLVHRLQAQNHVCTVVRCILQDLPCVHIQMPTRIYICISWKESVTGSNIIRLKRPSAILDIQELYDGASDRMVPVYDATQQILRKKLPPGKFSIKTR